MIEWRDVLAISDRQGWQEVDMPERVRLVHKVLDGRFHVYTSPDVKGLHITADTQAEAQRCAVSMLHAIAKELGVPAPVASFMDLADAA